MRKKKKKKHKHIKQITRGLKCSLTNPNIMKEYKQLHEKLQNKTITKKEKERLFVLAFGEKFMNDKNPNKKWKA